MTMQRVVWTEGMETLLVELWQVHPYLFDVGSQNYHDRNNWENSWREIAAQLQLTVNEVKTRVALLRMQYGKLQKPKPSSSGLKPPTNKQKWLLQHFDFFEGSCHTQTYRVHSMS